MYTLAPNISKVNYAEIPRKFLESGAGIRMQINFTDPVKNEVQQAVNEERSIPCTIKRRKIECIGRILRRNCLL